MIRTTLFLALTLAAGATFAATATPNPATDAERAARKAAWQADAKARFDAADADRDGRLDRVEVQGHERLARHFDRLDKNADGELTRDEIAQARGHRGDRGHRGGAFHLGLIKGMDDDGNEAISRAELGNKMPKWSEQFTVIDANDDGQLQRTELLAFAKVQREERGASRR